MLYFNWMTRKKTPEKTLTAGGPPKLWALEKVTGPLKNCNFWYQFLRFLGFFLKNEAETHHFHPFPSTGVS